MAKRVFDSKREANSNSGERETGLESQSLKRKTLRKPARDLLSFEKMKSGTFEKECLASCQRPLQSVVRNSSRTGVPNRTQGSFTVPWFASFEKRSKIHHSEHKASRGAVHARAKAAFRVCCARAAVRLVSQGLESTQMRCPLLHCLVTPLGRQTYT